MTSGEVLFKPRLCHLKQWPDFNGYGFNLHAEKGKSGQYIGKVDNDSPSSTAGLKEGDRIVEVNGINIGNENHQQVVERIKAMPGEVILLVVDENTDKYYKEQKLVVRGDMLNVTHLTSEDRAQKEKVAKASIAKEALDDDSDVPRARLCHLRIWSDFAGYGFNLHAEKGKPGQYIGKVDPGSPSEAGGLKEGDRIIEVNGVNIGKESHHEVVQRVKSIANETKLLVVDSKTDKYYKDHGLEINGDHPKVVVIVCPSNRPHSVAVVNGDLGKRHEKADVSSDDIKKTMDFDRDEPEGDTLRISRSDGSLSSKDSDSNKVKVDVSEEIGEAIKNDKSDDETDDKSDDERDDKLDKSDKLEKVVAVAVVTEKKEDTKKENEDDKEVARIGVGKSAIIAAEKKAGVHSPTKETVTIGGLTFAGTVAQAREMMKSKKKADPRNSHMSMKDKYDLFQRL